MDVGMDIERARYCNEQQARIKQVKLTGVTDIGVIGANSN